MAAILASHPRAHGFRMPAEWESHAGCWMIWPERPDNWRLGAKPAQAAFAAVAAAIAEAEPVTVAVSAAQFTNARARLPARVRVVEISTDDAWMRDTGPTFVTDPTGRVRGVDWGFNAWGGHLGGLYGSWSHDEQVAAKVLEIERAPRYRCPIVLEGGSIHVDGAGTVLTTEECLLNPNRNPDLSRAEIEEVLRDFLGIEKVLWLGAGLFNDETDGHIDNLACFARPGVVLLTGCDDPADPQFEISRDAEARLSAMTDARGRSIEVVRLPMPGPLYRTAEEADGLDAIAADTAPGLERGAGARLAGSYANFYIANGRIVMPFLDPRTDTAALEILAQVFPERTIVGVPAREILLGGGNIHCITQQVPAGMPG